MCNNSTRSSPGQWKMLELIFVRIKKGDFQKNKSIFLQPMFCCQLSQVDFDRVERFPRKKKEAGRFLQ